MKRADIIPALVAAVQASAALAGVQVVRNDFSERAKKAMNTALNDPGWVVTLPPIIDTAKSGQSGSRLVERVHVAVGLRVNPDKVGESWPLYDRHDQLIAAVLEYPALRDAGVRAIEGDKFCELITEDLGNVSHFFHFTVTIA